MYNIPDSYGMQNCFARGEKTYRVWNLRNDLRKKIVNNSILTFVYMKYIWIYEWLFHYRNSFFFCYIILKLDVKEKGDICIKFNLEFTFSKLIWNNAFWFLWIWYMNTSVHVFVNEYQGMHHWIHVLMDIKYTVVLFSLLIIFCCISGKWHK